MMLFDGYPLQNVLSSFKKLLKTGAAEATCRVSGADRRSHQGSVSSSPSCSTLSLVEDIHRAARPPFLSACVLKNGGMGRGCCGVVNLQTRVIKP